VRDIELGSNEWGIRAKDAGDLLEHNRGIELARKRRELGHDLTPQECSEFFEACRVQHAERAEVGTLRVIVYANPFAKVPLPNELFVGPFDEHWGPINDHELGRTFIGAKLKQLEALEIEFNRNLAAPLTCRETLPDGQE
jgi:hypothetical protein